MQLWLDPRGYRLWRFAYRFEGKQRVLALGSYPETGLSEARKKRDGAKALVKERRDPAQERRIERITGRATAATTFGAIADELIARKKSEGRAEATIEKVTWLLGIASAVLGSRPLAKISAAEVLSVLRTIESRGRLESARRLRSVIGEVFRYAIATARAENDPTFALRGALIAPIVKHRAAILDPSALGAFLRAVDGFAGQPETKAALQLLPHVFTRPGELTRAAWVEFDLDAAIWTVPPAKEKMRRGFDVPLSRQALEILRSLRGLTGRGRLVFPGARSSHRPISDSTLNAAMRRMGYASDEVTAHGFRATASTLLNESGRWSKDAIEKALAHIEKDAVRRAYNRSAYWEERKRMAQWWSDYLDQLRRMGP
ncbi:MAG: tyrosine-type recombinase/integrase [Hyphomicrobiales bacterium]